MLGHVTKPDPWFGIKYNMNIYRGCEHQCIYCDSRSECYGIEEFRDVLVKVNALELLSRELASKRRKGLVGTGSMSDPYTPIERQYNLTGRALKVLAQHRFPLHMITKSDMILRDIETLVEINRVRAYVSFTITTTDDDLARKLEPGAPSPSRRLAAMRQLAQRGITVGVTLMPVLPFIEDDPQAVRAIIERAVDVGASYVMPAFGMTMRDRQRDHYYTALDQLFPGMRQRYQQTFGLRYECSSPRSSELYDLFGKLVDQHGLATCVPPYDPTPKVEQMTLL